MASARGSVTRLAAPAGGLTAPVHPLVGGGTVGRDADAAGPLSRHPELTAVVISVLGLFVQVVGYALGWQGRVGPTVPLWYVGFVLIVAPFAWLLLAPARTGHQRLASSLVFTVVMYASWLLSNPLMSTRFDENLHVTTLVTLVDRSSFFEPNTMLPVSPHFPGLELATAGIHWLTGLPLFACQVLVVLTARVTFVLAFFLLASRIGRSTRVGATAVLLYTASAQFYFFNAQYSYQTVAIAMGMAAFYMLVRAFDSEAERPWKELLTAQVCLAGLAITHHLTSWLVLGCLWVLTAFFARDTDKRRFRLTLVTAELATLVVLAWTAVIAPLLIDYLVPIFNSATTELLTVLDGTSSGRQAGVASDGSKAPTWELMVMAGSVLLWVMLLLPAGYRALRGQTIGATRARYVPLGIALLYPCLQLARFSEAAGEVSDRASTFVTMAMALVVGAWVARRLPTLRHLVVPGALVLVLGGTIIGSGPDWQRVTGPYLAGAEQRSIDSTSVAVAEWAGTYLPEGSNVATDSNFSRLLPNFADVVPVTAPAGFESVTPLFLSHSLNQESLQLILHNEVDFIVVDTRTIGQTLKSGAYYEASNGYGPDALTVQADQIEKFEDQPGFDLVLDGPVKVYDVRPLRAADTTFAERDPPGLPGGWTPWQVGVTFLLIVLLLVMRGTLLDPRRFRARDLWRVAIVLPAAMLVGAVGVAAGFPPVGGVIVAVGLLYLLVATTKRAAPIPTWPTPDEWRWGLVVVVTCAASVALAVWSTWHGLLDFTALPPPTSGGPS
jgi:hypothetical protein